MQTAQSRRRGFTLIELLVVVAIIALLVSILLPSLSRAKALTKSIVCQNRFRSARTGFDYYSSDFNGMWHCNWERTTSGAAGQWPYTMMLYVKGIGISDGGRVLDDGGWFSLDTENRGGAGPYSTVTSPDIVPELHCPAMVEKGPAFVGSWYNFLTVSQIIPMRKNTGGQYRYPDINTYYNPDAMTHPGSTVHLQCMVYLPSEGRYNIWMQYGWDTSDLHLGKSNYLFADGHVESLAPDQTDEQMWKDMYEMGD